MNAPEYSATHERALGQAGYEIRRRSNRSQEDVAWAAGLHPKHLGMIELGKRSVQFKTLVAWARGLGVSPIELVELYVERYAERAR